MNIHNLAKIIFSNQINLNKICLGDFTEEFDKATFSNVYPFLHKLLNNSSEFQVMMDELKEVGKSERFIQDNYLSLKETENILKNHYKNLEDRVGKEKAEKIFIEKSNHLLNNVLPRFTKMFNKSIESKSLKDFSVSLSKEKQNEDYPVFDDSVKKEYSFLDLSKIIDPSVLEKLYYRAIKNKESEIIIQVLKNPNVPSWILNENVKGKFKNLVAENENISESAAWYLSNESEEIVDRLIKNEKLSEYPEVIMNVVKNYKDNANIISDVLYFLNLSDDVLLFVLNNINNRALIKKILVGNGKEFLNMVINKSSNIVAKNFAQELL